MLVNVVVYTFPSAQADRAREMLVELRDASRLEIGCLRYEVNRANDDPNVFVLCEEWEDRAALERHYGAEHFQRLGINGIRPLAVSRTAHLCTPLD